MRTKSNVGAYGTGMGGDTSPLEGCCTVTQGYRAGTYCKCRT
jgi:hypothetical protein